MPEEATLAGALEPFRVDPGHAAILLDIDGTLAPIVPHAEDAGVPAPTRTLLTALARRYGLVACVSGRRAADARRLVSIGSISYVGNHGSELLRAGSRALESSDELAGWQQRVQAFARDQPAPDLQRARVRVEDKGPIVAYHWRGAPDERRAHDQVLRVEAAAERAGLAVHHGRKVLEVRPPVTISKGLGVVSLLRDTGVRSALYTGDDVTDVDAFRALRAEVDGGRLDRALLVGVRSDETPAEVEHEADLLVNGTRGVAKLLEALLA